MRLSNVRLNVGSIEHNGTTVAEDSSWIEKPVKMVYAGKFESMDGPVEIKDEDIDKLIANHNSLLAKVKRMAKGDIPLTHQPPIQLDHSTSAQFTVGRLVGDLTKGHHDDDEGGKHHAVMGRMRILGKENVEKVMDGRWATVSIGADLEKHKVNEVSITPFPAAPGATMLTRLHKDLEYKEHPIRIFQDTVSGKWKWENTWHGGIADSEEAALKAAKDDIEEFHAKHPNMKGDVKMPGTHVDEALWDKAKRAYEHAKAGGSKIDDKWAFVTGWYKDQGGKFSAKEGDEHMGYKDLKEKMAAYAKAKHHLTEHKKMSEEEADKHLEAADEKELKHLTDEHDEHLKHLAEAEEIRKAEEEKMKKHMTKHKEQLVKLSKGVKDMATKVHLAEKTFKVSTRLSRLRAEAKVSPAELQAIKVAELAAKSDEAIDAALSSYEKRTPIIDVGVFGSTTAMTPTQAARSLKLMAMEKEELITRLNMPMKADAARKRLAEIAEHEKKMAENHVPGQLDYTHHMHEGGPEHDEEAEKHMEAALAHHKKLMDEGKHDEAAEHLKAYCRSLRAKHMSEVNHTVVSDPTPAMSALAAEVKSMQNHFNDFVKLTAPAFGATAEELL